MTWWVCTSKMNSEPVNACSQAAVSSGGGTLKCPPCAGPRLPRGAGRAPGQLERAERRRNGARALQEAPAVDTGPPAGVVDRPADHRVDGAVVRGRSGRDEFPVGHRTGGQREYVVVPITLPASEPSDPTHGPNNTFASPAGNGAPTSAPPAGHPCRDRLPAWWGLECVDFQLIAGSLSGHIDRAEGRGSPCLRSSIHSVPCVPSVKRRSSSSRPSTRPSPRRWPTTSTAPATSWSSSSTRRASRPETSTCPSKGSAVVVTLRRQLAKGPGVDVIESGRQHGTFRRRLWVGDGWNLHELRAQRRARGPLRARARRRRRPASRRSRSQDGAEELQPASPRACPRAPSDATSSSAKAPRCTPRREPTAVRPGPAAKCGTGAAPARARARTPDTELRAPPEQGSAQIWSGSSAGVCAAGPAKSACRRRSWPRGSGCRGR